MFKRQNMSICRLLGMVQLGRREAMKGASCIFTWGSATYCVLPRRSPPSHTSLCRCTSGQQSSLNTTSCSQSPTNYTHHTLHNLV